MDTEIKRQRGQQVKFRLSDDLYVWLKKMADENDRSVSYLLNQAVKSFKHQREI